jgi:hypothetical protein
MKASEMKAKLAELNTKLSAGDVAGATAMAAELTQAVERTGARAAWEAENAGKAPDVLSAAILPEYKESYAILVVAGEEPKVIFGENVSAGFARIAPKGAGGGNGERNPITLEGGIVTGDTVKLEPINDEGKAFIASVPDAPKTGRLGTLGKAYGNVGKSGHQVGSVVHYRFFEKHGVKVVKA